MEWITNNIEWIFSGVGVLVISIIFHFLKKNNHTISQNQKSGSESTNIQVAGNVEIHKKNNK